MPFWEIPGKVSELDNDWRVTALYFESVNNFVLFLCRWSCRAAEHDEEVSARCRRQTRKHVLTVVMILVLGLTGQYLLLHSLVVVLIYK